MNELELVLKNALKSEKWYLVYLDPKFFILQLHKQTKQGAMITHQKSKIFIKYSNEFL